MVSDGLDPTRRYRIAVEVTIAGSEITFDFSASDDQAPGFTNMPPASATGAVRIAFLMLMNAGGIDVPTNEGLFAARDDGLPGGVAPQPALPGLVDLRQSDVRRGARVDHARPGRGPPRPRDRGLEPAPLHDARRHRPAHRRAVGLALDLHARRTGRDEGRRRLRRPRASRARPDRCARPTWRCSSSPRRTSWSSTSTCRTRPGRASGAAGSARSPAGASTGSTSSA